MGWHVPLQHKSGTFMRSWPSLISRRCLDFDIIISLINISFYVCTIYRMAAHLPFQTQVNLLSRMSFSGLWAPFLLAHGRTLIGINPSAKRADADVTTPCNLHLAKLTRINLQLQIDPKEVPAAAD